RLRAAEMVDVEIGIPPEPLVHEIHQRLERATLAVAVVGPKRLVAWLVAVEQEDAEKIFEPAGRLEERGAFQIEHHVAGRARGQVGETAPRLDGTRSPLERARPLTDELQAGLLAQAIEGRDRHPGDGGARRSLREPGQRFDAPREEPLHLIAVDACDPDDVILLLQSILAESAKVAERAMDTAVGPSVRSSGRRGS